MQRNRGKQQNEIKQRSLQENWRDQVSILCKDGHDKAQKTVGPNRSSRGDKNTQKNYTRKTFNDQKAKWCGH